MKIRIAAIILVAFGQQAWAESNVNSDDRWEDVELKSTDHGGYFTSTVCIDGYKFVVAAKDKGGIAITQFFKEGNFLNPAGADWGLIHRSIPVKCDN